MKIYESKGSKYKMVDEHWVDDAMYDMSIIALLTENTWHGTVDDNFSWFVVYIYWLLWN